MQYPILPKLKNREINTFYLFQDEIRFWNGKRLLCKCKHRIDKCKNCSPEGYQAYLEREKRRHRKYRKNNRQAELDRHRRYRENNLEAMRDMRRRYRKNNREAVLESQRKYREKIERLYEILL